MSREFPYPDGFIIGTCAPDGDCLDGYIITKDKAEAGSIVACDPVALLEQEEDGEIDHTILAAMPGQDAALDQGLLEELRDFIYALIAPFPDMHIRVGRILPQEAAVQHIQEFRNGYLEGDGPSLNDKQTGFHNR